MKDVDAELHEAVQIGPRHELPANFTSSIVAELKAHPRPRKENIFMKFVHSPVLIAAAVVGVLALGGTTYATTDGFKFLNVLFGSTTTLGDGSKIVKLDTKSCATVDYSPSTDGSYSNADHAVYYKLTPNSKLHSKDLAQVVQGECELTKTINDQYESVINKVNALYEGKAISAINSNFADNTVESISSDKMTVRTLYKVGIGIVDEKNVFPVDQSKIVIVDVAGNTLKFADIKIGDHIALATVAQRDEQPSSEQLVAYIQKHSANISIALATEGAYGKEFVRVAPCQGKNGEFCSVNGVDSLFDSAALSGAASGQINQVIQTAYNQYIAEATTPLGREHFSQYLTPEFKKFINANNFEYDPITCYQQIPDKIVIGDVATQKGQQVLHGTAYQHGVAYDEFDVVLEAKTQKIENIICNQ